MTCHMILCFTTPILTKSSSVSLLFVYDKEKYAVNTQCF